MTELNNIEINNEWNPSLTGNTASQTPQDIAEFNARRIQEELLVLIGKEKYDANIANFSDAYKTSLHQLLTCLEEKTVNKRKIDSYTLYGNHLDYLMYQSFFAMVESQFREIKSLDIDAPSENLKSMKDSLIELIGMTKFSAQILKNDCFIENVFKYLTTRCEEVKSLQDIFKTRLAPATLVLNMLVHFWYFVEVVDVVESCCATIC
jgi:hypothetical protein